MQASRAPPVPSLAPLRPGRLLPQPHVGQASVGLGVSLTRLAMAGFPCSWFRPLSNGNFNPNLPRSLISSMLTPRGASAFSPYPKPDSGGQSVGKGQY